MSWAERAADRSPVVRRSKKRGVQQAKSIVEAARRLIEVKQGTSFTTQELVKEAGIALQTFYRYFPGKDHLLLAVLEDVIEEGCAGYEQGARHLSDPVERLRFFIAAAMEGLEGSGVGPSFVTAEHWRLQKLYPEEVSRATRSYTELLLREIEAAASAGLLRPADPRYSAWLITQLVMAVFHHYDCSGLDEPVSIVAERMSEFCLSALGLPARG